MAVLFKHPESIGERRVKAKIAEVGEVAVILPDFRCWNVMIKVIFEDNNQKRYVKLYEDVSSASSLNFLLRDFCCSDVQDLLGKDCVLIVEKMRDAVGDVWPKIKAIELGGEKCEHNV